MLSRRGLLSGAAALLFARVVEVVPVAREAVAFVTHADMTTLLKALYPQRAVYRVLYGSRP